MSVRLELCERFRDEAVTHRGFVVPFFLLFPFSYLHTVTIHHFSASLFTLCHLSRVLALYLVAFLRLTSVIPCRKCSFVPSPCFSRVERMLLVSLFLCHVFKE